MVARIRGEVKDTFNYIDANNDSNIDMAELKGVLAELGETISHDDAVVVFNEIDTDGNGLISYKEFEQWYLRSAEVMRKDVRRLFKKFSTLFFLFWHPNLILAVVWLCVFWQFLHVIVVVDCSVLYGNTRVHLAVDILRNVSMV